MADIELTVKTTVWVVLLIWIVAELINLIKRKK